MTNKPAEDTTEPADASDVISGPIGDASLRDPATSGPEGAHLEELPIVEPDGGEAGVVPART